MPSKSNGAMFDDLDGPLNASHGFVSINIELLVIVRKQKIILDDYCSCSGRYRNFFLKVSRIPISISIFT